MFNRLFEPFRQAKARKASKAARALSIRGIQKQDDKRQAKIDELSAGLGRPSFTLMRRGRVADHEPLWADVDGVELRLPPGRLPPFCGRKTDSARAKIASSNTESQYARRADKALRRFSWESGE